MGELLATPQTKKIAEAIILQAVEDLWRPVYRKESIDFFTGEGFVICAELADFGLNEKLKLAHLIHKAAQKRTLIYAGKAPKQSGDDQGPLAFKRPPHL